MQYHGKSVTAWRCGYSERPEWVHDLDEDNSNPKDTILVATEQGNWQVNVGDWVVRHDDSHISVLSDAKFKRRYNEKTVHASVSPDFTPTPEQMQGAAQTLDPRTSQQVIVEPEVVRVAAPPATPLHSERVEVPAPEATPARVPASPNPVGASPTPTRTGPTVFKHKPSDYGDR